MVRLLNTMIFEFPNLDTLRFALTSGLIPAEVSSFPATAARGDAGTVWVEPSIQLSYSAQKELRRIGVEQVQKMGSEPFSCLTWLQILPLRKEGEPVNPTLQTPVLFELPSSRMLPGLVSEMLRLGNDRQGYRFLDQQADEAAVLLRVIGPPYYSLLQALDRDGQISAPRAYLERAPRIWVEIGYTHPLVDLIKPPVGKLLFLRPPHDWWLLEESPFHDIYDILEFPLPHAPVKWHDWEHHDRLAVPLKLTVPLRLAASTSTEPPELWVLRASATEQLEWFVRNSSDELLARLSFAVGESEGKKCVVLRVRPSRQAAPVLVLEAQAFRSYMRLPNLFVPCGKLVQPMLRRDAIRRLLVPDAEQITWLYPHEDGTFTPESLPDQVFRPLPEWVEYVLSTDKPQLQAWMDSALFEFDRFITKEERRSDNSKEKAVKDPRSAKRQPPSAVETADKMTSYLPPPKKRPDQEEVAPLEVLPNVPHSELQARQHELENRFLAIEGALDSPQRQALWPELALIYTAQKNLADAALCWVNALWEENPEAPRWVHVWHQANRQEQLGQSAETLLEKLLRQKELSPSDLRLLVSLILDSAYRDQPELALMQQLGRVQSFVQAHESRLPVRAIWLVGMSFYRLAGGDVLVLARTRDRILERLFNTGLTVEQDLPAFLRFTGANFSDRFQAFRDWLTKLPERVHHWLDKVNRPSSAVPGETFSYAELILAFGFARLGEKELTQGLLNRAKSKLADYDDAHTCLLAGFTYRIEQCLQGSAPVGPLPAELHEYLNNKDMARINRYMVDRLRQYSRILEPHEKINPYRAWHGSHGDELGKQLSALPDIFDLKKLEEIITHLLSKHTKKDAATKRNRARILSAAIELSPRLGQNFALPLLGEVNDACDAFRDMLDRAKLLERALFVAAHFDQPDHVKIIVGRFQELLQAQQGGKHQQELESLAAQCFRGLRKLGMRDVIEQLLGQLSHILLQGRPPQAFRQNKDWPALLRSLLQVASGWFYFGMNDKAKPIIEEARQLLYRGDLDRYEVRKLARAYINLLGQAPADIALRSIDELFSKLKGIYDTFTTREHYSLSQLEIIEAVVLAIVTEDFAMGSQARRWLDEDEYLVRKRIHQDLNQAMSKGH